MGLGLEGPLQDEGGNKYVVQSCVSHPSLLDMPPPTFNDELMRNMLWAGMDPYSEVLHG